MQSFVEVIKFGSFSEAAKILGLSRALISRHITDLERSSYDTFRYNLRAVALIIAMFEF